MYFLKKKIFHFFWIFGRLFPNNHRNMFCRFHVSLINGFPLPKTRKCQIFGKVVLIKKGQSRHIPWNLLYFQPEIFCKIYRCEVFFHFLTCMMFDRTFEMNIDVGKISNSIFFAKLFKCSLLFIVLKGCFYASSCRELRQMCQHSRKMLWFFYDQLFSIAKFQVKRAKLISFY